MPNPIIAVPDPDQTAADVLDFMAFCRSQRFIYTD